MSLTRVTIRIVAIVIIIKIAQYKKIVKVTK